MENGKGAVTYSARRSSAPKRRMCRCRSVLDRWQRWRSHRPEAAPWLVWRRILGHRCWLRGGELCALAGGGKEDEVWRGEKVTLSLLFIAGLGGGSGLIAPTLSAFRGGNGRTTCPTS